MELCREVISENKSEKCCRYFYKDLKENVKSTENILNNIVTK